MNKFWANFCYITGSLGVAIGLLIFVILHPPLLCILMGVMLLWLGHCFDLRK